MSIDSDERNSNQDAYISTLRVTLKGLVDTAPFDIPEPTIELYREVDAILATHSGGTIIYSTALLLGALGLKLTVVPVERHDNHS